MPLVLRAARDAGATHAGSVMLRLPGAVATIFAERLTRALPLRAKKVLARVREGRGGKLYDARFGERQRGRGPYAEATRALFEAECRRLGLRFDDDFDPPVATFRRPSRPGSQLALFST
jgi:DNA repair photolyase